MLIFPTQFYYNLKRYWRRRKYHRLDGANSNKKNMKIARFGGKARRCWKIRAIPKLRLKISSPKKLLARIRDAYVDMMVGLGGNSGFLNSGSAFGERSVPIPKSRSVRMSETPEEFEKRVLFEIYKSLVPARQLTS